MTVGCVDCAAHDAEAGGILLTTHGCLACKNVVLLGVRAALWMVTEQEQKRYWR